MSDIKPVKQAPVQGMSGLGGGPTSFLCAASPIFIADPGQAVITNTSTTSWTVPDGVYSVSVVCIGAGGGQDKPGGGGGALAYGNDISVTPGTSISVQVGAGTNTMYNGGSTYFNGSAVLQAGGGGGGGANSPGNVGGSASGSALTAGFSGGCLLYTSPSPRD